MIMRQSISFELHNHHWHVWWGYCEAIEYEQRTRLHRFGSCVETDCVDKYYVFICCHSTVNRFLCETMLSKDNQFTYSVEVWFHVALFHFFISEAIYWHSNKNDKFLAPNECIDRSCVESLSHVRWIAEIIAYYVHQSACSAIPILRQAIFRRSTWQLAWLIVLTHRSAYDVIMHVLCGKVLFTVW